MNPAIAHLVSSTHLLLSTIATSDHSVLLNFSTYLSALSTTQPPDHLNDLLSSIDNTIKVELSTRKPQ